MFLPITEKQITSVVLQKLELIFDASTGKPSYELGYNLPGDQNGYAGLAFQVKEGSNLSAYNAVECKVAFSQLSDVVDLYFKNIARQFQYNPYFE